MTKRQIQKQLEIIIHKVDPNARVEILKKSKEIITILVVSESFVGVPLTKRFKTLSDLLEEHWPQVCQEYCFIFNALSKTEEYNTKKRLVDNYEIGNE